MYNQWPIFAASDINIIGVISVIVGLISTIIATYIAIISYKQNREREKAESDRQNLGLAVDSKLEALKREFIEASAKTTYSVPSLSNELRDFKERFSSFQSECSRRHEQLSLQGSLSDLKARVDELAAKISALEDFRHSSADRYVLMVNYQNDLEMLTNTISALREDIRSALRALDGLS